MPPWKCILSFLLVLLTTSQVWSLNTYIIPYTRSAKQNWQAYLIQPDIFENAYGFGDYVSYRVYDINWLVTQVDYTVDQYYDVENMTVGNFILPREANGEITPPLMTVNVFAVGMNVFNSNREFNNTIKTEEYDLSLNYFGPFTDLTDSELTDYVHTINDFSITFSVENDVADGGSNGYSTCYSNSVSVLFDFSWRGRIDITVAPLVSICNSEFEKQWYNRDIGFNVVLIVLIFTLSAFMQVLLIKSILKRVKIFQRVKHRAQGIQFWKDLDWREKLKFFNLWFVISTLANIFNVLGGAFTLKLFFGVGGPNTTWRIPLAFTGVACACTWFALVQFFEHFPKYYELILTLKMSAPRVMRLVVGCAPIYLGFAMFGVSFFSPYSDLFKDLGSASVTLFALLNGDVIHDVFMDLDPAGSFIAQTYLYVFNTMFIYAVLNIFIASVEDGFFAAKRRLKVQLAEQEAERKKDASDINMFTFFNGPPLANAYDEKTFDSKLGGSSVDETTHTPDTSTERPNAKEGNDLKEPLLGDTDRVLPQYGDTDEQATTEQTPPKRVLNRRQLMEMLVTMQNSLNKEFLIRVQHIVSSSSVRVRPPHNPDCFPCDFDDCIYCVLKQVFKESLKDLETCIHNEVEELKNER